MGAKAKWITGNHPLNYPYGPGSPYAKLCEAKGKVLLLGAPLDTLTILHHAETIARIPNKRIVRYKMPILRDGERIWVEIEDIDTAESIADRHCQEVYFVGIAREYIAAGKARSGKAGNAQTHLFDAADLVEFAVHWLETRFGEGAISPGKELVEGMGKDR